MSRIKVVTHLLEGGTENSVDVLVYGADLPGHSVRMFTEIVRTDGDRLDLFIEAERAKVRVLTRVLEMALAGGI